MPIKPFASYFLAFALLNALTAFLISVDVITFEAPTALVAEPVA